MTIEIFNTQVSEFLRSDNNEVLAIRGKWGIGKTYSWNNKLNECAKNKLIKLDKYSYVSLFGMNNIDNIKSAIFENIIDTNVIGEIPNLTTFSKLMSSIKNKLRQSSSWIAKTINNVFKSRFPLLQAIPLSTLYFLTISKTIVCFDDFERIESSVTTGMLLGLINELKFQKKCKVVLIFNDEKLDNNYIKKYNEFREKVIDIDLLFDPSPKECADTSFKYSPDSKILTELCTKLKIRNIRILLKIDNFSRTLRNILNQFPEEISYQAFHSMVLFTYCFYSKEDKNIPDYDKIKTINYSDFISEENKNAEWKENLQFYDYLNTDDFDLVIYHGIKNGYFDKDELIKQAEILSNQLKLTKSQNSFHEAWNLFHDNFNDNKEDVVNQLYNSFLSNIKYLHQDSLNSLFNVLNDLGERTKGEELVNEYIKEKKGQNKYFDLKNIPIFGDTIIDPYIKDKFDQIISKPLETKSIEKILDNIAIQESWSSEDEKFLNNVSAEDIYKVFKSNSGKLLRGKIKSALLLVPQKTKEALKKIGNENKLNELRIKKYNID